MTDASGCVNKSCCFFSYNGARCQVKRQPRVLSVFPDEVLPGCCWILGVYLCRRTEPDLGTRLRSRELTDTLVWYCAWPVILQCPGTEGWKVRAVEHHIQGQASWLTSLSWIKKKNTLKATNSLYGFIDQMACLQACIIKNEYLSKPPWKRSCFAGLHCAGFLVALFVFARVPLHKPLHALCNTTLPS